VTYLTRVREVYSNLHETFLIKIIENKFGSSKSFRIFALNQSKQKIMTPFEQKVQTAEAGGLKLPDVTYQGKKVPYFIYQLIIHRFNLNIMAGGMKFRNINLTDIKREYGLKGRSAKDCLAQFDKIMEDYKAKCEKVGLN